MLRSSIIFQKNNNSNNNNFQHSTGFKFAFKGAANSEYLIKTKLSQILYLKFERHFSEECIDSYL